jgi:hypothetical protein
MPKRALRIEDLAAGIAKLGADLHKVRQELARLQKIIHEQSLRIETFTDMVVKFRRCNKCGALKPLDAFYTRGDGDHHRICIVCQIGDQRERRRRLGPQRTPTDGPRVDIRLPDDSNDSHN